MSIPILARNRGGSFAAGPAAPSAGGSTLENVAVVGNTAALEGKTNEDEGFIAYNDATFQLWVSSGQTTASATVYTKQNSGT